MPSPCCMHPALALLAAALLAGAAGQVAARPAGTRPPQPNPDFFAMHPLASESRVGVRVDQANMCEQGYTVAGIAFS